MEILPHLPPPSVESDSAPNPTEPLSLDGFAAEAAQGSLAAASYRSFGSATE